MTMTGDFPGNFEAVVSEELHTAEQLIGGFYDLPQIAGANSSTAIGVTNEDHVERVLDRVYSIQKNHTGYSLNDEDFLELEYDIAYMLPPEYDSDTISRRLFIGMGVAGTAVREIWARHDTAFFKRSQHQDLMKEYFCSKVDIDAMIGKIFDHPDISDRKEMTEDLTDKDATRINGLRLRQRILFDASGMAEFIGIEQYDLIQAARKAILEKYKVNGEFYDDVMVVGLGQAAKEGDKLFFDALSDFTIASATPLPPQQAKHLFSPAWTID